MKRLTPLLLLALSIPLSVGCHQAGSATPPLAPGYTNSIDQSMGQTLAAAHAFYNRLQQDAAAGTFHPTPKEISALDSLQQALNTAQPLYLAYHAGSGDQALAQQAVNDVTQKQAAIQALGVK